MLLPYQHPGLSTKLLLPGNNQANLPAIPMEQAQARITGPANHVHTKEISLPVQSSCASQFLQIPKSQNVHEEKIAEQSEERGRPDRILSI